MCVTCPEGVGRGAAEGDPLTMTIRPIGTRRQMETEKFRNLYIGNSSTARNAYTMHMEQRSHARAVARRPPRAKCFGNIYTTNNIPRDRIVGVL